MKLLVLLFFTAIAALAQPATTITINQTRANGGTGGNCLKVNTNGTVGQVTGCGGGGGAGTVTSVTGTTNQITVVNPTTTPVVSLTTNTAIPGSPTTTTQAPGDSSTKVATTAFVTGAISTACTLAGNVTGSCGANTVIGIQTGTTLPATCSVGDVYSLQGGTPGIYSCLMTANNWVYIGPATSGADNIGNHLLSGCGVEYVSGLTFTVGACNYTIQNANYSSAITSITLTAANMTNPRIDVIVVNNAGIATKIDGTAAMSPAEPSIDPSTQIALIFVTVPAGSSTPASVTTTLLYDENVEWTCASSANINCASTNNPYHGTKDIEATAAVLGNNFTLVKPAAATQNLSVMNNLVFYIRSKAAWPAAKGNGASGLRTLSLFWLNGSTQVGTPVVITDGAFGFNSSNTTGYQQISIPIGLFGTGISLVTTLKAQVTGNGGTSSFGWYIDEVSLQSNGVLSSPGCVIVGGANGIGPDCALTTNVNPLRVTSNNPLVPPANGGTPVEQVIIDNPATSCPAAQTFCTTQSMIGLSAYDGTADTIFGWLNLTAHTFNFNPVLADMTVLENNSRNGGGVVALADQPTGVFDVFIGANLASGDITAFRRMRANANGVIVYGNDGTVNSLNIQQTATNATATKSYIPVNFFDVNTTTGQIISTASNYSNASVDLAADSFGIFSAATSGQFTYGAAGSSGKATLVTGGSAAAQARMEVSSAGVFTFPNGSVTPLSLNTWGGGGDWIALPYAANTLTDESGTQVGQYMKDATGRVWVRGTVTCNGSRTITGGTTVWTFPAGFRPTALLLFQTFKDESTATSESISVDTGGLVKLRGNFVCTQNTDYLQLDGIFSFSTT